MPLQGHTDEISRARVSGWALETDRPDEAVSLSIYENGVHRGVCEATAPRSDVILSMGETVSGARGFRFEFDPPLSPFAEHRVEVRTTWAGELLPNGARTLPRPARPGAAGGRVPILVTSTGRSGTTLLMSEMARHPDIVVGDRYPFEIKQIGYHAAAFRVLTANADRERSTHPETMLDREARFAIGSNPYNEPGYFDLGTSGEVLRDYWENRMPGGYASLFRETILDFYDLLARGQGKGAAPYFCEKGDVDEASGLAARLFFDEVKEILIVRDPRDLLCSSIAFWKLPPGEAMTMLQTTFPRLSRIARHAGPDTMVIRYEDLVRDPLPLRRAMSLFLGIDLTVPRLGGGEGIETGHRTSGDTGSSIGRWRNDLSPELLEICEATLEPYFHAFDYELSRPSVPPRAGRAWTGREPGMAVVAEGQLAVSAFFDNNLPAGEKIEFARPVFQMTFGRQGNCQAFVVSGWSDPERDYVWTVGHESQLRLPAIRREGDYRLLISASPFTHGEALPVQRLTLLLDGRDMGTVSAGETFTLDVEVPRALTGTDHAISVTLCLPDAARPSEVSGSRDTRVLGLCLYRIVLLRLEHADGPDQSAIAYDRGIADGDAPMADRLHGPYAERIETVLREAFERPDLEYRPKVRLRDLAGADPVRFIRLILGLEAAFDVTLAEEQVDNLFTIGDVGALIGGLMEKRSAPSPG